MKAHTRCIAAALIAVMVPTMTTAHETWLMPKSFSAEPGEEVRFDLTSGMAFPKLESPIKPKRVARAQYRLDGRERELTGRKADDRSLHFRREFPTAGVATVWLELYPKDIELTDEQVEEYLDEIEAGPDVRAVWASRKGHGKWKETYVKHAKTLVAVGAKTDDRSWATPVGQAFELIPLSNPLTATVADELSVELRHDGKPLPRFAIGLRFEGSQAPMFRMTDGEGRATFPLAKEGRALLYAVRLLPVEGGNSWTGDFCTLTFAVSKRP